MASNILLDYAFKFTEIKGAQPADLSYLKKVAVVVKAKTSSGADAVVKDVTSPADAVQYTDAENLDALFSGGLSIITLIICENIGDCTTVIDEAKQYTVLIDVEWDAAEIKGLSLGTFKGVVGASFGLQADAEAYAALEKHCAFLDATSPKAYGMYYAFGKLLSGVFWRDQQYVSITSTAVYTVEDLGIAEALFSKKVSFYLGDSQYGKKLGFFGAGGEAITVPYINEEMKRIIQSSGVNYLALNQPRNISISRIRLESTLQDVIDGYAEAPYLYLDPDGTNEIILSASNVAFTLNGTLAVKVAEPIWRVAVQARQEA